MAKHSAGLLMFRHRDGLELLLAHPGGPLFARKDDGAWTIPKGLLEPGEDAVEAARREFEEETGFVVGTDQLLELGEIRQRSGKIVTAWAFEGDCDPAALCSNTFEMIWPPRSGRRQRFAEIDRVAFFGPGAARRKLLAAQSVFVDRLEQRLTHR